jgi:hypothetical protein
MHPEPHIRQADDGARRIGKDLRAPSRHERNQTAVMAVPLPALREKLEGSNGSNGSTSPSHSLEPESVREEFEERAAIQHLLFDAFELAPFC